VGLINKKRILVWKIFTRRKRAVKMRVRKGMHLLVWRTNLRHISETTARSAKRKKAQLRHPVTTTFITIASKQK
jgi:hypothetical protein